MPRSSREKSAETRANIIETSYQLFLEHGYSATSMRMISQRAGVTVGAIYNHFTTKEEIWKEIILTKHPYHQILPHLLSAEGDTVAEVVRSTAKFLVHELYQRSDLFNLMFIEIVEFQAKHTTDLFMAISPQIFQIKDIFSKKKGNLRNIPAPVLIRSFVGLFMSYYITGIFVKNIPGMEAGEETLDQFVNLYLYGILEDTKPEKDREA